MDTEEAATVAPWEADQLDYADQATIEVLTEILEDKQLDVDDISQDDYNLELSESEMRDMEKILKENETFTEDVGEDGVEADDEAVKAAAELVAAVDETVKLRISRLSKKEAVDK